MIKLSKGYSVMDLGQDSPMLCLRAHLTARKSWTLKSRLRWPAPAKAMMASRCSCRSSEGPGALVCVTLTSGSDAIPVLLRLSLSLSQRASRASLYLPPLQAARSPCASSEPVVCVPRPQLQESRPQSSAFCVLPCSLLLLPRVLSWLC